MAEAVTRTTGVLGTTSQINIALFLNRFVCVNLPLHLNNQHVRHVTMDKTFEHWLNTFMSACIA